MLLIDAPPVIAARDNPVPTFLPERTIKVLYVGADPEPVDLLCSRRTTEADTVYEVTLSDALPSERLPSGEIDVIVLDLETPDQGGLADFLLSRDGIPEVPLVVLVASGQARLAVHALGSGAVDALRKSDLTAPLLACSLRHAIERHRLQAILGSVAVDPLTGLYNRRSFLLLAEQSVRFLPRTCGLMLLFANLVGLHRINRQFSYREGDRALVRSSQALTSIFRKSDIIARAGDSLFSVLATDVGPAQSAALVMRLREALEKCNPARSTSAPLTYRIGFRCAKPTVRLSLGAFWGQALEAVECSRDSVTAPAAPPASPTIPPLSGRGSESVSRGWWRRSAIRPASA